MSTMPVYLTDLPSSERLTLWTIRRLAAPQTARSNSTQSCGVALPCFLPCFRREFLAVTRAFHEALSDLSFRGDERPARPAAPATLDIRTGGTLAVTETEYTLLLATEAAQNEREDDMHTLLRPLLPLARLRLRMMTALTTLGACLAGAGYWLSPHAARNLSPCLFSGGVPTPPVQNAHSHRVVLASSLAYQHH
jgi:hypothetical protein